MDPATAIAANVVGGVVLFGGIALCVRIGQQGKTRRRELEHVERMRAIELGRPVDYSEAERFRALGAMGVVIPIVTMVSAAIGSGAASTIRDPWLQLVAVVVIWTLAVALCFYFTHAVLARMKDRPPVDPTDAVRPHRVDQHHDHLG